MAAVQTVPQMPAVHVRQRLKRFAQCTRALLATPLLILYWLASATQRDVIRQDVERWTKAVAEEITPGPFWSGLLHLLGDLKEFRTLYLYRLRRGNIPGAIMAMCLERLYSGQVALSLRCPEIGPGLFLQHGFSTTVGAQRIGRNCWINQQVTVGFLDRTSGPVIGDNVTIHAGAKVLGPITIGNNVKIGANAVVVKNVPDNCVVVGVPARIVRRNGIRVDQPL